MATLPDKNCLKEEKQTKYACVRFKFILYEYKFEWENE